jgi:uncharacterized protein
MRKTNAPTYQIANDQNHAGNYYRKVSRITDLILEKGEEELDSVMEIFSAFTLGKRQIQKSRYELQIELLTQGILWIYYSRYSTRLTFAKEKTMSFLNYLRAGSRGKLKSQIDKHKGWIMEHFFPYSLEDTLIIALVNPKSYNKWLKWLRSSGEYYHEAHQLSDWYKFWKTHPEIMKTEFPKILGFSKWFLNFCQAELGMYTANISEFRNNLKTKKNREDRLQTGKREGEYFLNMIGAKILNLAYRDKFLKCNVRTVFVPGCMRAVNGHNCKAVPGKSGIVCAECNVKCNIYKITMEGKRKGFNVRILLHESNMFSHSSGSLLPEDCAIVGVACVPCLLAGGWKVRSKGLPVQCVLLNYSGCNKHWHDKGIATNLDLDQLNKVMAL